MKRSITPLLVALILALTLSACTPVSGNTASTPEPTATPTILGGVALRALAQPHHLFIGTAVNVNALQSDPMYARTLAQQFDMVTPENALKFDMVEPQQDVFDFKQGDELVAFARAHGMQVRGHNFVWYEDLPNWLTSGNFTRDQLMTILRNHITTVMKHYQNEITIWDVVNEAVNDDGSLRPNIWLNTIGPDYIAMAFRWAHEADPQAHLFYNDYNADGLGFKSDVIYNLLKNLLQNGVPIYGVGLEMHHTIFSYPTEQDVLTNMHRLAALGLKVQITEMDVSLRDVSTLTATPTPITPTAQQLTIQAQMYHDMLAACLQTSACEAFVMWGFVDRYSWLNGNSLIPNHADAPLIFDEQYHPKPAFYALVNALEGQ